VTAGELATMCAALVRRGPDEEAYFLRPGIGLGLRRLSIIGLEPGRQPVRNEDGSIVVVMNGEIYNYRELRRELEERGHAFATGTDTETIAHLYEEFGVDCVRRLRGMFAFALWDARRQRLFIGRDRLGIKPLYYAEIGGRFVFASELKAILALPGVPASIDFGALDHFFASRTTPPDQSIVAGVQKLEPAHILVWSPLAKVHKKRYWRLRFRPDHGRSEAETVERLRTELEDSVRQHLVSDVPVGAFLSGGVDSSAVVATMSRLAAGKVRTFTIGFKEAGFDESRYARRVAQHLGTEHHELILGPEVEEFLEDFAWDMDEPFGDASAFPTFAVSRLASRHLKVVLSGDGGDELFAGYDRYAVEARERRREVLLPAPVRRMAGLFGDLMEEGARGRNFLRHLALSGMERWCDAGLVFRADSLRELYRPEVAEQVIRARTERGDACAPDLQPGVDWLSRMQRHDLENYLPLDILTKVDRMSMANSLEARVPLLDHRFVEFAATIPPEMRIRRGVRKYVLKKALEGWVPEDTLYRKKQGFATPLAVWFRTHLEGLVREKLLSAHSQSARFLNPDYIERLLMMHAGGRPLQSQLWTLISFEMWCRRFVGCPLGEAAPALPSETEDARRLAVSGS